jgi:hypothetical protein
VGRRFKVDLGLPASQYPKLLQIGLRHRHAPRPFVYLLPCRFPLCSRPTAVAQFRLDPLPPPASEMPRATAVLGSDGLKLARQRIDGLAAQQAQHCSLFSLGRRPTLFPIHCLLLCRKVASVSRANVGSRVKET